MQTKSTPEALGDGEWLTTNHAGTAALGGPAEQRSAGLALRKKRPSFARLGSGGGFPTWFVVSAALPDPAGVHRRHGLAGFTVKCLLELGHVLHHAIHP